LFPGHLETYFEHGQVKTYAYLWLFTSFKGRFLSKILRQKSQISREQSGILAFCKKFMNMEYFLYNRKAIFNFDPYGQKLG
jgi:hypothetical protein